MSSAPQDEVEDLKRTVNLYRGVLILFVAGAAAAAWKVANHEEVGKFGLAREVWTVDVNERLAEMNSKHPDMSDIIEVYFKSDAGTVHGHYMGFGQTTPMHIHRDSHEAVLLAGGTAEIRQIWGGDDGTFQVKQEHYEAGSVIASPPNCGHEWVNPQDDSFQINLVITVPQFKGNLYVHDDDVRMLEGSAPFSWRAEEALPGFNASGKPYRLTRLPTLDGKLYEVMIQDDFLVPPNIDYPVVGYVASGRGNVDGKPLGQHSFFHVEQNREVVVAADAGYPLAIVMFDPMGAFDRGIIPYK